MRGSSRKAKMTLTRVIPNGPKAFRVVSDPHPLHVAHVRGQGDGTWKVTVVTEPMTPSFLDSTLDRALVRAGTLVGKLAGRDIDRFTRAQAYAMGQQRCPYLLDRYSGKVCSEHPDVGSVWCHWHPLGKGTADGKM